MSSKAWQLGSPGSLPYRFYDGLRKRLNLKLVQYLLTHGMTARENKVLEAGSGPAFASSILAADPRVAMSVAVDFDLEALEEARRRDPALMLVLADVHMLPFRSESLDLTWNSSTVEHLPDPAPAIAEMQRVTRKSGTVFVGVPNRYGPLGFEQWIRRTAVGVWIGKTYCLTELKDMSILAGLTPKDSLYYFFRFFVGVLAEK
jgi:SAM-dependent methyltransferase